RQPEALALLETAFSLFLRFAVAYHALDEAKAADLLAEAREAFVRVGVSNRNEARHVDPAEVFVETVRTLFESGGIVLVDRASKYGLYTEKGGRSAVGCNRLRMDGSTPARGRARLAARCKSRKAGSSGRG